jgi:hypothetical protein
MNTIKIIKMYEALIGVAIKRDYYKISESKYTEQRRRKMRNRAVIGGFLVALILVGVATTSSVPASAAESDENGGAVIVDMNGDGSPDTILVSLDEDVSPFLKGYGYSDNGRLIIINNGADEVIENSDEPEPTQADEH